MQISSEHAPKVSTSPHYIIARDGLRLACMQAYIPHMRIAWHAAIYNLYPTTYKIT